MPFKDIVLEPEQEELFAALVEAARNVPRDKRRSFRALPGDDQLCISHPGLAGGARRVAQGDINALEWARLVAFSGHTFDVTPLGLAYYQELKRRAEQPTEQRTATSKRTSAGQAGSVSRSVLTRYRKLLDQAPLLPLSQLLPSALIVARALGKQSLEKWIRLEQLGYLDSNPVLTEDVEVPSYRWVAGERRDEFGRPLVLRYPDLQFLNQFPLRPGVAELERLAAAKRALVCQDPVSARFIRERLGVEVTRFVFHPSAVSGVLSAIRGQLADRLHEVEPQMAQLERSVGHSLPRNRRSISPRKRGLKCALIATSLLAVGVFCVSYFVQPLLPAALNSRLGLLIACLVGVVTVLGGLNEAFQLFDRFLGKD